jgi:hypothetical protein
MKALFTENEIDQRDLGFGMGMMLARLYYHFYPIDQTPSPYVLLNALFLVGLATFILSIAIGTPQAEELNKYKKDTVDFFNNYHIKPAFRLTIGFLVLSVAMPLIMPDYEIAATGISYSTIVKVGYMLQLSIYVMNGLGQYLIDSVINGLDTLLDTLTGERD